MIWRRLRSKRFVWDHCLYKPLWNYHHGLLFLLYITYLFISVLRLWVNQYCFFFFRRNSSIEYRVETVTRQDYCAKFSRWGISCPKIGVWRVSQRETARICRLAAWIKFVWLCLCELYNLDLLEVGREKKVVVPCLGICLLNKYISKHIWFRNGNRIYNVLNGIFCCCCRELHLRLCHLQLFCLEAGYRAYNIIFLSFCYCETEVSVADKSLFSAKYII